MLTWKSCFLKSKHWFWYIPSMDSQLRMLSITINFLLNTKSIKRPWFSTFSQEKKALKYFTESTNHWSVLNIWMFPVKVLFKLWQSIKIPLWFSEELTRLVIQFVFFTKSTSSSTTSTKWRIKTSTSTPATTTPSTISTTTKAEKIYRRYYIIL